MGRRNRYAFGIEVIQEVIDGTYVDPTKPLCIQADSDRGEATYKTQKCNIASTTMGGSYDVVLDATKPKGSIPIKQPLPLVLGGIEDVILSARLKKTTETAPDRTEFTMDSANSSSVSVEVTTLRTVSKYAGGKTDFKISGEVNNYIIFDGTISASRNSKTELAPADPDNTLGGLIIDGATGIFYYSCENPILINGASAMCKKFEFSLNPVMADGENDEQCKTSYIVDFESKLTITADQTSDLKFKTSDMVNGTEFNIKIPFSDNTGAEKGYLLMPKCVLNGDPKESNTDGMEEVVAEYSLRKTTGDDNFAIAILT